MEPRARGVCTCRAMIPKTILAALLAVLIVAPTAEGAMCVRLSSEPTSPRVGAATVIEMRTFFPTVGGRLEPWIVRRYPFRVVAFSPRGKTFRITVRPSRNPYAWRGAFRFGSAGVWTVRVTNFSPSDPTGCGRELRLRVRAR